MYFIAVSGKKYQILPRKLVVWPTPGHQALREYAKLILKHDFFIERELKEGVAQFCRGFQCQKSDQIRVLPSKEIEAVEIHLWNRKLEDPKRVRMILMDTLRVKS